MNGGMLVFHNSGDTSYANHSRNLSSMSSATGVITLRFLGQGASATATSTDAVVLTVTGGKEEIVMEFLASVMANPQHGMQVIADDNSSYYSHANILTVSSISVDNGAGTFRNIIPATFTDADTGLVDNRIVVTNAMSGSEIRVSSTTDADSTIYLPASPIDGCNFRFTAFVASTDDTITITAGGAATVFYGITQEAGAQVEHVGTASAVIQDTKFLKGDWFYVVYQGAQWHITGQFDGATALVTS